MSTLATAYNSLLGLLDTVNWPVVRAAVRLSAVLAMLAMVAQSAVTDPLDQDNHTLALIRDDLFDFSTWEFESVLDKARVSLVGVPTYLGEAQRQQLVRDYLELVNEIASLEDEATGIYADPNVSDPDAASASLRARRDELRARQAELQPLVEAIIQAQISDTYVKLGFGTGGQLLPPIEIRFTQLPRLLVISPRDHIERVGNYALQHSVTVDELEALEERVDSELDVSSLAVPLGGLAVYPAMLIESGYAPHIFEITAHEWAHHYLSFYPLGFNFGVSPDLYTMNETVASIIGEEVGQAALAHYYPDMLPPPPQPAETDAPPAPESEPPAFDFREEMRLTRIHVDELLAEGRIEEAEAYMEARRAVFVENGYEIRKLNQAYFAFFGSYADEPGASGQDPIGPAIRELRDLSPSLRDFVVTVRPLTTFEQLKRVLEEKRAAAG